MTSEIQTKMKQELAKRKQLLKGVFKIEHDVKCKEAEAKVREEYCLLKQRDEEQAIEMAKQREHDLKLGFEC